MKIVKPSHEILIPESPYKHIERIGRICYKSENSITDTSAEPFCNRMVNNGHHAMIEHYRFIISICKGHYIILKSSNHNRYITFTNRNGRYIISASARGLQDMFMAEDSYDSEYIKEILINIIHYIIKEYNVPQLFDESFMETYDPDMPSSIYTMLAIKDFNRLIGEEYIAHAWYSVHFVCDRGVSHELVRHRDASFAQESTRYCNYSKDKFGDELTFIYPYFFNDKYRYNKWKTTMDSIESSYMRLLKFGATPQEARTVLPNSLKTEIVITAQVYEWLHIFDLRVLGTTGKPHPQMVEVMKPVRDEMIERGFIE